MDDRTRSAHSTHYKSCYGNWVGAPKGHAPDYARCCAEVAYPPSWQHRQCTRKRGHGPDGAYCKQHDPDAVRAKRLAQQEKWEKEWAASRLDARHKAHAPAMLAALRQIAEGHNDPRELAAGIVAAFEADGR